MNAELESFLRSVAGKTGLEIEPDKAKKLINYWQILQLWNKKVNLIGPKGSIKEQIIFHVLDSLIPLKFANLSSNSLSVCDIGSGGGIPAIPLKVMLPHWNFTLVESINKKALFLKQVGRELGFSNFLVKAEFLPPTSHPKNKIYDLITARGVSELVNLIRLAEGYLKPGGCFWFYKGPKFEDELKNAQEAMTNAGVEVEQIWQDNLPCMEAERFIIVMRKQPTC